MPYDDACITYRYVINLLSGYGPVCNLSERVFDSTTPLYVVWLALLKIIFVGVDLPILLGAVMASFILFLV